MLEMGVPSECYGKNGRIFLAQYEDSIADCLLFTSRSINFQDQQNLKIQHTASFFFFFRSELSGSSWSIPALTTIKGNNSSYLCKKLRVILLDYNPVQYRKVVF